MRFREEIASKLGCGQLSFVSYEAGRGRVGFSYLEVLLACKFLFIVFLRLGELSGILGINRQSSGSLATTIQRLSS